MCSIMTSSLWEKRIIINIYGWIKWEFPVVKKVVNLLNACCVQRCEGGTRPCKVYIKVIESCYYLLFGTVVVFITFIWSCNWRVCKCWNWLNVFVFFIIVWKKCFRNCHEIHRKPRFSYGITTSRLSWRIL